MIIGGGIAAYKSLELIRLLRKAGADGGAGADPGGAEFVTPLSLRRRWRGSGVSSALFDLTDEAEMGHIELSRSADLVVVAPATADLMAKLAHGLANDLASTLLLATDKRVLLAPAMNVRMWLHPATQRNLATLRADGALVVGPDEGEMACGEFGPGRMAEPAEIARRHRRGARRRGHAGRAARAGDLGTDARADRPGALHRQPLLRAAGHGDRRGAGAARRRASPSSPARPRRRGRSGATVVEVETAAEMLAAVEAALPADAAVFAAAVADWRVVGGERRPR